MTTNRDWLKLLKAVGNADLVFWEIEQMETCIPMVNLDICAQSWFKKGFVKDVTFNDEIKEFFTEHPTGILALEDWVRDYFRIESTPSYFRIATLTHSKQEGHKEWTWIAYSTPVHPSQFDSIREAYIEAAFYRLGMEG